jgi:hypothetical protein
MNGRVQITSAKKEPCFLEYDELKTLKTLSVLQTKDNFKVEGIDSCT